MAWKAVTLLALFALSEARPPKSEQRVKTENWLSHSGSHHAESHEDYASAYPSYEFTYEVSDPHTHDFKGHHEQRKGDDVKGYYWLVQPDGLKRTVKYNVDEHSGFKAHVDYIKHWEEENKKEEGEANEEENNSAENENSEENGQENESTAGNDNEAEQGERENNESTAEGEGENREEQIQVEEANQEGEETEQKEEQWGWIRGRNHLARRNERKRDNEENGSRPLKATVGVWHSHGKRHRKEKKEERHQETQNNENNERTESNQEEQRNESNENSESHKEHTKKGEVIKSEYHVIIHHPKH